MSSTSLYLYDNMCNAEYRQWQVWFPAVCSVVYKCYFIISWQKIQYLNIFVYLNHGFHQPFFKNKFLYSGTPFERPPFREATPLERPLEYVNPNIKVLINIPFERPPLLKGHFSGEKEVTSQKGSICIGIVNC